MFDLIAQAANPAAPAGGGELVTIVGIIVTSIVVPAGSFLGIWIKAVIDRRAAENTRRDSELSDCQKQHAADRELIGGLQASVKYLGGQLGEKARAVVDDTLREAEAKSQAVKNEPAKAK